MANLSRPSLGVDRDLEPGQLDRIFMALADSSRRHIVAELAERGELSVGEAGARLDLSPAGISKHVKVLEEAGLVRRRLSGRRHLLSLESDRLLLAEDWIDRYRTVWTESLARLAALAAEIEPEPRPVHGQQQQGEPT